MPQSSPAIAQTPQVPRTAAQLGALRQRREELREQLESVTEWRGRLVQERHNAQATGNTVVVQDLDGRIKEFGDRSKRIEQSLIATDDAIAQALANGVSSEGVTVVTVPRMPRIPEMPAIPGVPTVAQAPRGGDFTSRDIAVVALGQTLGFLLLAALIWRIAFRRGARSVQPVAGGRDVNQLQQSVDAIAVEIERISENQRYVTKMLNEGGQKVPERNDPPRREG